MSVSPCSALISFLLACFSLRRLSSSCSGKNLIVKVIRDVNRGVAIKAKTCLLLGALLPPFVDVLLQLLVQLALLRLLARLQEVPISPDLSTGIVILGCQEAVHLVWFIGTAWEFEYCPTFYPQNDVKTNGNRLQCH